jgi:signal transduction histidine kinase
MNTLFIFHNLDLLSVGFAVTATVVLGFAVYFNNPKSITNKALLWFALVTAVWGTVNYLNYQTQNPTYVLWLIRLVMFFAAWQAYTIFLFMYVFPRENVSLPILVRHYLIPTVIITSILTLTPFVFSGINLAPPGQVSQPIPNWGIVIFGIVTVSLVISGIVLFLRKFFTATPDDRQRFWFILIGSGLMFLLIIVFNFIAVVIFNTTRFIPLGALFVFPFIAFTSYAILKHRLFNVRAVWAGILVFLLAMASFSEVILARELALIIYRSSILILVLVFGVLLIRGIMREVEQKEQLEIINKKLEELNRLKSEFLSFASHQVKAPMAVVKGYAELIYEGIENVPEQAKDFAKKIKESVDNLLVLIEEFMDYRRIEEGKIEFNFEKLDIISLIREMVEKLKLLATEKNLSLDFESKFDSLVINVDKLRFSQVIQNLIDNAIKYTKEGWVKVKVDQKDNEVLISVSDSGVGMSKELQEKLFGQFVRDPSIKKEIRGTGLGLYIAKHIIEAHKGKIWAESEGIGKGSTFYIKLPMGQ